MKEIEIKSWDEFQTTIASQSYKDWLYRGQADSSWKLESSLFRILKKNEKIRNYNKKRFARFARFVRLNKENYETEIINHFMKSAHLYLSSVPDKANKFDWLSVMQHYGAPTRILDFSFSPYVALFFALSEIKTEAAVYCIKFREIMEIDKEYYDNIENKYKKIMEKQRVVKETLLLPFEPGFTNSRLQAQQGAFLIPNTLDFSHDEIFEYYKNDDFVIKLIIKIENVYKMFESLIVFS
jgi:hypothetical protein